MDGAANWGIGILTLAVVLAPAAAVALRRSLRNPPAPEEAPTMRDVLREQARRAEKRAEITYAERQRDLWLDAFARRLMELWSGLTYDEARQIAKDHLDSIGDEFGDPRYDWSIDGAREEAEEYARVFGEAPYGANG